MNFAGLTPEALAAMIDHTLLKPFGRREDIERLCREAREYGFTAVAINPAEIEHCVGLLVGSSVRVGAAVGFPLGQNTAAVKEYEAKDAIGRGAREIDMVINLRALQSGDLRLVREEIAALVRTCRGAGAISKVVLETCYLSDEEKRQVCRIALAEGADFVKTSTGFGAAGARVEDILLMREVVGKEMGVKAAGGIRDLDAALAMVQAGATRIGTSSGVAIVEEMRQRLRSADLL